MDETKLTRDEKNAIASLKRLANRWPGTLRMIVIDGGDLTICKYGVSCDDVCEIVDIDVQPCCVLTDIHGEQNEFGNKI